MTIEVFGTLNLRASILSSRYCRITLSFANVTGSYTDILDRIAEVNTSSAVMTVASTIGTIMDRTL